MTNKVSPERIAEIAPIFESTMMFTAQCFLCEYYACDTLENATDGLREHLKTHATYPSTLTKINTAINNDTTLSEHARRALIELMRVAYEEVRCEKRSCQNPT